MPNKKRLKFFDKDQIDWTGQEWLHGFYETLLTARHKHPALGVANTNDITTRIKTSADDKIFAFARQWQSDEVIVILHLSPEPVVKFYIEAGIIEGHYKSIFSGFDYHLTSQLHFEMSAWNYLVYIKTA